MNEQLQGGHSTHTGDKENRPLHAAVNGWFVGDEASGTGQYVNHLLAYLGGAAAAVRITVLAPARSRPAERPAALPPAIGWQPLRLPRLPENLAKLWWEQFMVPQAVRRLRADLLWTPYWAAPWWQPASTVVTIHDLIPLLLSEYRGGVLPRLYTRLVSATARRCTAVITVSEASRRDVIAHLGIAADRVHAVGHGPNQENAPAPTAAQLAAVRTKYQLPEHYFLYLGGFDVRKNLRGTLSAYRRYLDLGGDPTVKMVIAGRLPASGSAFFPDPRQIAAELSLGDQVHFCGWIDEADKLSLYAMATAYIFPSRYEGFGMMVLEAQQAGTAVVTSG